MAPKKIAGPMTVGSGYVFKTITTFWSDFETLEISAAGTFHREDIEFIRDALTKWLVDHPRRPE